MNSFFLLTLLSPLLILSAKADVNMKDASYFKTWIDLEVRKENNLFQLRRSYHSRSLHPGIFGFGWCSDFEKRLDLSRSDQISLTDCRLTAPIRYKKKKENVYESPNKEILEFKDNIYLRTTAKKTLQKYNKFGKLISLTDSTGNRLDLSYSFNEDPQGLLQKITFNKDIDLTIKWDPARRHIQNVITAKFPPLTYRYEGQNLVQMSNAWKNSFSYQYDDLHNLTRISYPDKTQELLTYDKEKDWILLLENRDHCIEIFKYIAQEKNSNYTSTAEKRCAGKTIHKTVYEFRHKGRADGSKYLDQVKVTQGKKIQRISYQNSQGPLNESQ